MDNIIDIDLYNYNDKDKYYSIKVKLFYLYVYYMYDKNTYGSILDNLILSKFNKLNASCLNTFNFIEEYEINSLILRDKFIENGWIYHEGIIEASSFIDKNSIQLKELDNCYHLISKYLPMFEDAIYYNNEYTLSCYKNEKLGRYLSYIQGKESLHESHTKICNLIELLKYPYTNYSLNHVTCGIVNNCYYMFFLEGNKTNCFNYSITNFNVYFPIYSKELDKMLDIAILQLQNTGVLY